jgi:hypothetical protein
MSDQRDLQLARGSTERAEFGSVEIRKESETGVAAAAAREQAIIGAEYIAAERHPRRWGDVRVRMMDHCSRPRFAEVSRYRKPVGKKYDNGQWIEQFATGFTIRMAETLAQEMGNVKPWSQVTYEDDMLRIVRIGVTDLERNVPWSREVSFARTVERRGKKRKPAEKNPATAAAIAPNGDEYDGPEGREVLSVRMNSKGEPTFLVRATEDELRAKVNSEMSKTHRDFIIKLTPRDLLEDWEDMVYATMQKADKADPQAAVKRWVDSFHRAGIAEPSDLEHYVGRPAASWNDKDVALLRELAQAIKEGQTTFAEALQQRYEQPLGREGREKTVSDKIDELEGRAKPAAQAEAEAPAPPATAPTVGSLPHYDTWEDWERDGAKAHSRMVIMTGEGAGEFAWNEPSGNHIRVEPVLEPALPPKPGPREVPKFGKFGRKP